jgi:hypothetical protein
MRFRRNRLFEAQMKASPRYQASMAGIAQRTAKVVWSFAPHKTGAYGRSIKARENVVYSDDPFAHLVEFGSTNNPAYAPLRRGVRAAGLRFVPLPKQ